MSGGGVAAKLLGWQQIKVDCKCECSCWVFSTFLLLILIYFQMKKHNK